jgi:hypothetical protein
VKNVAYGEGMIISEWFVDYKHADWGKVTPDQVSVQTWKNGRVVHERSIAELDENLSEAPSCQSLS